MSAGLETTKYGSLVCPMPVVALRWYEDDDWAEGARLEPPVQYVRACGEEVDVTYERADASIGPDGEASYDTGTGWKVQCRHGHVLVCQAIEDEGDVPHLDYRAAVVAEALALLAVLVPTSEAAP